MVRVLATQLIYVSIKRRKGIIPDDDPFESVLTYLMVHDPVLDARANAIQALEKTHAASACNTLNQLVTSTPPPGNPRPMQEKMSVNDYLSASLYVAVKNLGCPGADELFKPADMELQEIINIYAEADPARFFGDRSHKERVADKVFNRMDVSENFDEILVYINHPSQVVRNRVVQALARSKRPEALVPLLRMLRNDPNIQVRDITIYALGANGYKESCPELEAVLTREEFGTNTSNTKSYLTVEKIHSEARLAMSKLHCNREDLEITLRST